MREREGFPAGVPCWVDTAQPDPKAAVDFYGSLFGWDFEDRMPQDGPGHYFVARVRGREVAAVGSQPGDAPPRPTWNTYIAVESADEAAAAVQAAGGTVLVEPFDVLDAGRMAMFTDPAGAAFSVWQAGTHKGAQAVNEPSTWNWSDLNTSDPERAKAFYGAVFGWEASTVSLGQVDGPAVEGTMWRLPGYADFLEQLDPDLRARHAEFGAPEGFSDCIGWMVPLDAKRTAAGVAPHWSVTFLVDDADSVAARCQELAGTVLVPPVGAGPVRTVVLRDPQGATFSVNQFDPGQGSGGAVNE